MDLADFRSYDHIYDCHRGSQNGRKVPISTPTNRHEGISPSSSSCSYNRTCSSSSSFWSNGNGTTYTTVADSPTQASPSFDNSEVNDTALVPVQTRLQRAIGRKKGVYAKVRLLCWTQLAAFTVSFLLIILGATAFRPSNDRPTVADPPERIYYYYLLLIFPIPFLCAVCVNVIGCTAAVRNKLRFFRFYTVALTILSCVFLGLNGVQLWCSAKIYAVTECRWETKCQVGFVCYSLLWVMVNLVWVVLPIWSLLTLLQLLRLYNHGKLLANYNSVQQSM